MQEHKSQNGRRKPRNARKVAAVSAVAFLVIVGAAFGFYLAFANGSGGGSAKLGEATAPSAELALSVGFAPGLMPGQNEELHVNAQNPASSMGQIKTLQLEAVSHTAGCLSSWFTITPESKQATEVLSSGLAAPVSIDPGSSVGLGVEGITLTFVDSKTNQNACSGANLEVVAHSQP